MTSIKQTSPKAARISLTQRPLDLLYFIFFLTHIGATLCVDLQAFYPAHLTPTFLKSLMSYYLTLTADPTMTGVLSPRLPPTQFAWFRSLLLLEACFQLPTFFIGAYMLYKNDRRVWLLLIIYGASTATTLVPVLGTLMAAPGGDMLGGVTMEQRGLLLGFYLPYLALPLFMCVEVAGRVAKVMARAPVEVEGGMDGRKKMKVN